MSLGHVEELNREKGVARALPLLPPGWRDHPGKGWGDMEGRHLRGSCSSKLCLEATADKGSSLPRLQRPRAGLCWHHSILQRGLGCCLNGT